MQSALLLDTCAAIWLSEGAEISAEATRTLDEAYDTGVAAYVSPITAWEIGLLVARHRMAILVTPEVWFRRLTDILGFQISPLPAEILIASSFLPGTPPKDPADRILAATAREYGYTLVTRDRPLLAYGAEGHIQILAC